MSDSIPAQWYHARQAGPYHRPWWLLRLRGISALLQLAICGVAWLAPSLDFPLREVAPLLLILAAANGAIYASATRAYEVPAAVWGMMLVLEVGLLTWLLELTGGPFNPFSVIFAAHVAVAFFTLGRAWASVAAVVSAVLYGLLVYDYLLPAAAAHHRLNDFPTHLFAMWVAIAATSELAGYFITRASQAIAERQQAVEAAHARAARSERVAALTTLAAGAAHELSTPLGTIAVAVRELERSTATLAPEPAQKALHDDAHLIRTEVDRCQAILDQMSGRAGGVAADEMEVVALEALTDQVRQRLVGDQRERLQVSIDQELGALPLPRAGLVQVMTSLVNNAFEASDTQQPIWLTISRDHDDLRVTVRDNGRGVAPSTMNHVGEPFYTTKPSGRGLGLFLARVFAERFGGSLTLASGQGTRVTLELPIAAASAR